jgi:hypothetical protein
MNTSVITLNSVALKLHTKYSVARYCLEHIKHRSASSYVGEVTVGVRGDVAQSEGIVTRDMQTLALEKQPLTQNEQSPCSIKSLSSYSTIFSCPEKTSRSRQKRPIPYNLFPAPPKEPSKRAEKLYSRDSHPLTEHNTRKSTIGEMTKQSNQNTNAMWTQAENDLLRANFDRTMPGGLCYDVPCKDLYEIANSMNETARTQNISTRIYTPSNVWNHYNNNIRPFMTIHILQMERFLELQKIARDNTVSVAAVHEDGEKVRMRAKMVRFGNQIVGLQAKLMAATLKGVILEGEYKGFLI